MIAIKGHWIRHFILILVVIVSCDTNQQIVALSTINPTVLKENGAELFQYWEFNNSSMLWEDNRIDPINLKSYKDSLNSLLGFDTIHSLIQKIAEQDSLYKSIKTRNGDSINAQLIHSKVLGKIRPINYLESQLLDYQLNRFPLLSHPTEFHGFILLNDSLNTVRVYFAASDQPWPPKPHVILSAVIKDLKNGWTFKYHLHNHYEPRLNNYLGILAPSITDAQYYSFLSEEYNLENAIITNGFNSVEIQEVEFKKLKTPECN
jgi:hypothetical protein